MPSKGRNIVVIGTSAGGLQALDELIGQLPSDLPASLCIVQHMDAENTGAALLHRLSRHKTFECKLATNGEVFKRGRVYIAPADYHLLIKRNHFLVTKGARENRFRPAIDPLFRSAAVTHGPRVIGVILSGMLNDGTAGLAAIKKCGGIAVVQDPKDAAYPDMSEAALRSVNVDHCVPIAEMGRLLEFLTHGKPGKSKPIPQGVRTEAEIAERVLSDVAQVNTLGKQVPYNCPGCGGVLWQIGGRTKQRYRCHTGHSFTESALLASQTEKIEETLWVSLRMLEERKNLLDTMMLTEKRSSAKVSYAERLRDTNVHIERIRAMLLTREPRQLKA
ncbi:MAG TPA: chemotaxis protein CheB [Nitrospirales bacterium]|jgi:two-component system chemotaxis response regulator CheB